MKYSFGSFVRHAIATHLGLPDECVEPAQRLREDLGLFPLDVVLVTLSMEDVAGIGFPVERLDSVRTVEELSQLLWACRSAVAPEPRSLRATQGRTTSFTSISPDPGRR